MSTAFGLALPHWYSPSGAAFPWNISATAAEIRDAIATLSQYGETLGPELVTNGDFSGGTTGWVFYDNTTITPSVGSVSGGVCTIDSVAGSARCRQTLSGLVIGRIYRLTVDILSATGSPTVVFAGGGDLTGILAQSAASNGAGTVSILWTATATSVNVGVRCTAAGNAVLDNIRVREVVAAGWQIPGASGARINAAARTSVAMEQAADGTWGFARHNVIRNSTMQGAAPGTPGTNPTNWIVSNLTGITRELVSVGVENGLNYVEYRLSGTAGATFSNSNFASFELGNVIAAAVGQTWTATAYVRLSGGSLTNVTFRLRVTEVGGSTTTQALGLTSPYQRFAVSRTFTGASTAFAQSAIAVDIANGAAIDVTIRIAQPELYQGAARDGILPTVGSAVYAPAIDWLSSLGLYGLRSEAAATNLLLWSSDLTNAVWSLLNLGVGVLPVRSLVAGAGLDGGAATRVQFDCGDVSSSANRSLVVHSSVAISNATTYTLSFWVKAYDSNSVGKTIRAIGEGATTSTIVTLTADWQRVTVSGTSNGTSGNALFETRGTFTTQTADVLLWCPQLETGSRASSPILTYGSSATRAADLAVVPYTAGAVGTLVADYVPQVANSAVVVDLDDTTANEVIALLNDGVFSVTDGGAVQVALDGGTPTLNAVNTMTGAFAVDDFAARLNSGEITADVVGTVPTTTRLVLGDGLGGHITRVRTTTLPLLSSASLNILGTAAVTRSGMFVVDRAGNYVVVR